MNKTIFTKILIILVLAIFILSFLAPLFVPHNPNQTDLSLSKKPPSKEHLFGTDIHGRDVFSRTIVGARTSIFSALSIVIISMIFGTTLGIISGYYGGRVDSVLMSFTDLILAFPSFVFAIAIAGILGGGIINAMIALGISNWTQYARLARSLTISEKENTYIKALKFSGNSDFTIMFKHILINIFSVLIVTATLNFSTMLIGIAGLSFLGIGVKIPTAEWGSMISEGRAAIQSAPWISLYPALAIVLVTMLFNLLGDNLRDIFNLKREN